MTVVDKPSARLDNEVPGHSKREEQFVTEELELYEV
jgi:hypothetical protein